MLVLILSVLDVSERFELYGLILASLGGDQRDIAHQVYFKKESVSKSKFRKIKKKNKP